MDEREKRKRGKQKRDKKRKRDWIMVADKKKKYSTSFIVVLYHCMYMPRGRITTKGDMLFGVDYTELFYATKAAEKRLKILLFKFFLKFTKSHYCAKKKLHGHFTIIGRGRSRGTTQRQTTTTTTRRHHLEWSTSTAASMLPSPLPEAPVVAEPPSFAAAPPSEAWWTVP